MVTSWVVVPADNAALSGASIGEGLLRFRKLDPVVGASLILARGQSVDGLWLEVTEGYTAPMAGRDIATLSQLGPLANVVIVAGRLGRPACDLIATMFSGESISFDNEAGVLTNAFNRPAPAVVPVLWWLDGDSTAVNGLARRPLNLPERDC